MFSSPTSTTTLGTKTLACNHGGHRSQGSDELTMGDTSTTRIKALPHWPWRNPALRESRLYQLTTEEPSTMGIKTLPHWSWRHSALGESKIYHTDHAGTQHHGNQGFPTLTMEDTIKLHSSQAARRTVSNLALSAPSSSPAMSLLAQSKASRHNCTELCHRLRGFLEKIISLKKQSRDGSSPMSTL